MKANTTTNAGKNPIDRIDMWALGHFDFLLGRNFGDRYHQWVIDTKQNAIKQYGKFKKLIDPHYPNERK